MSIQKMDRHQRVVVMGLGLFGGGVGAARFWSDLGAEVTVTDLRDESTLKPSLEALADTDCRFVLGSHEEEDFKQADVVIVNPAVKPDNRFLRLARGCGAELLTEVGLVLRIARCPVVAITGSNGKSTTTSLIGAMLRQQNPDTLVGGNIGGSLLSELPNHMPSTPIVLELSSFQLHYLRPQQIDPHIAVITNLSPNHLDWHRTVLNYYEDKRNLLRHQSPEHWAVLNLEDPTLREWAEDTPAQVMGVAREDPGSENACYLSDLSGKDAIICCRLNGSVTELARLDQLQLPGRHNILNALQAAAAVFLQTGNPVPVGKGLDSFTGLPHRLEQVCASGNVRFINDSIATTPESTICALQAFDEAKVLIAGGYDKGTDFDELGRAIVENAHAVVLIGNTACSIREAIERAIYEVDQHPECYTDGNRPPFATDPLVIDAGPDFDSAVRVAGEICPEGGVVLLSPACASYDMFANFEQRGDVFRKLVQTL